MTAEEVGIEGGSPIEVSLELDLEVQPIEGTLSAAGRPPSPFVGWLGLTAALEGLRRRAHPAGRGDGK